MSRHLPILLALLLATYLRLTDLPSLPPGLNFDEAGNGVAALDILHGQPRLWWTIGGGKEPLWPYLLTLSMSVLGTTPLAIRWPAALLGVLTIAAVYRLVLHLNLVRPQQTRWLATLAALSLAVSPWHLHFSRLGFRAILLPLLTTLGLWMFLEAGRISRVHPMRVGWVEQRETQQIWLTILAAFFLALGSYTYLAGRLLPFIILIVLLAEWLYRNKKLTTLRQRYGLFFASYTLFLLPLIIYFTIYPAHFATRAGAVSIFNPEWHQGDLLGTLGNTILLTLGTFVGLTGDSNPLVNLPGQPAVAWWLAPFLVVGMMRVGYQLVRSLLALPSTSQAEALSESVGWVEHRSTQQARRDHSWVEQRDRQGATVLCAWWLVMLAPAVLAPEGAPHHLRLLGTIVPTHILIALGLMMVFSRRNSRSDALASERSGFGVKHSKAEAWEQAQTASQRLGRAYRHTPLPALFAIIILLTTGWQTYQAYFVVWSAQNDFTLPYDLYATQLAEEIKAAPSDIHYILPMDIRAQAEARHYTLDYLLVDQQTRYRYIPVDERNAEIGLDFEALQNLQGLNVVRWTQDKHLAADEKEIVTFLLTTQATLLNRTEHPVYTVESYRIPADFAPRLPAIDQPIQANFDNLLRLDATYLPETVSADETWLPVAITVAPIGPMMVDYKASLRLLGADGARLSQKDRTLRHNFHQGTSLWPPETVNEYYLLPLSHDLPTGDYTVTIVFYDPNSGANLVSEGVVEIPLGRVKLLR